MFHCGEVVHVHAALVNNSHRVAILDVCRFPTALQLVSDTRIPNIFISMITPDAAGDVLSLSSIRPLAFLYASGRFKIFFHTRTIFKYYKFSIRFNFLTLRECRKLNPAKNFMNEIFSDENHRLFGIVHDTWVYSKFLMIPSTKIIPMIIIIVNQTVHM